MLSGEPWKVGWVVFLNVVKKKKTLYAEYIMRNAGLEEAQTGIKIAGKDYQ